MPLAFCFGDRDQIPDPSRRMFAAGVNSRHCDQVLRNMFAPTPWRRRTALFATLFATVFVSGCASFGYPGYSSYGYQSGYYSRYYDPWYSSGFYDPYYARGYGHGFGGWSGFWGGPWGWGGLPLYSVPVYPPQKVDNGHGSHPQSVPESAPGGTSGDHSAGDTQLDAEGDTDVGEDFEGG